MSLGVVIKCGNDERVLHCMDSVDHPCTVAASGFFAPNLRRALEQRGVIVADAPRGNLGRTTNIGIAAVGTTKVVVMDSDSWFGPGTLALLDQALDGGAPFARARILYAADPAGVRGSQVVARSRQHLNDSLRRAYTPGLGLRVDIAPSLGGHLFDDRICFAEDAEMDFRRREANIPLLHVEGAVVHHAPVALWHDLRAAFRVGYGKAQQVQRTTRPNDEDPLPFLQRAVRGEHPAALRGWARELGAAGAAWNTLWFGSYYLGYYDQRVLQRHP